METSKQSTQKAFSCCDAILETGPMASMRSQLVVGAAAEGVGFIQVRLEID
jgi:hypothetical protein